MEMDSDYERKRELNIHRNREMMKTLGLDKLAVRQAFTHSHFSASRLVLFWFSVWEG